MNKELERIKNQKRYWQDNPGESYSVSESTFEWLIEQAERVNELEEENERLRALDIATTHELNHVDKINNRYREAIENIKQTSTDFRNGHLLDIQDSFFVDEIIAIINKLEESE